jgi:hypothetical protein
MADLWNVVIPKDSMLMPRIESIYILYCSKDAYQKSWSKSNKKVMLFSSEYLKYEELFSIGAALTELKSVV